MKDKKNIIIIFTVIIILLSFLVKNNKLLSKGDNYVVSGDEDKQTTLETSSEKFENINNIEDIKNVSSDNDLNKKISIYISGAVNSPGVVELNSSDRLMNGVNLCGGLTNEADTNRVNLAMKVKDEGHYIIPKIGEEININIEFNNENDNSEGSDKKININNATKEELDSLPGVGEVTAQKILDYREENKEFKSIDEIKNVKGIGENKFNNLKDYICIQ